MRPGRLWRSPQTGPHGAGSLTNDVSVARPLMHPCSGRRPLRVMRIIARMNVGGPAMQVASLQSGLDPTEFETRLVIGEVASNEVDLMQLRLLSLSARVVPGLGRAPRP